MEEFTSFRNSGNCSKTSYQDSAHHEKHVISSKNGINEVFTPETSSDILEQTYCEESIAENDCFDREKTVSEESLVGGDALEQISYHTKCILQLLGEDVERDGLVRTPSRVANALTFLTGGYHLTLEQIVNDAVFDVDSDDLVLIKDIPISSMCEHHMLPFFGLCHVGYIPKGKVLGLSKFSRVVDMFARRLQVQERLCDQIAGAIHSILNPTGVIVVIEASHMCMMVRGVCKNGTETITRSCRGLFKDNTEARSEFIQLCQSSCGRNFRTVLTK